MEQKFPGPAVRITLTYVIIASIYIIASDQLLLWLLPGQDWIQSYKGLAFVIITGALLFGMFRAELLAHARAEQKRRESEAKFASAFRTGSTFMAITNLAGQIIEINTSYLDALGYTREDVIGKTVVDLGIMEADTRQEIRTLIQQNGAVRDLEVRVRARNDAYRDCLMSVDTVLINQEPHWLFVLVDITERKQLADQLRYQALLLSQTSDAVVSTDLDFKVQSLNPAAERIYGWKTQEVVGKPFGDLVQAEYIDTTREEALKQLTETGQWSGEVIHQRKHGGEIHFLAAVSYVTDSSGNRIGVVAANRDITHRKRAEEALRENEQHLQSILDNMMEGCQIIGFDWRYIYLNDAAVSQSHKTKEELLGHTMMEVYPGIEGTAMFDALQKCMAERVPEHMVNEFVYPDKTTRWFEMSIQPALEGIFILATDITERKQLEQDLLLTQFCVDRASIGIMRTGSEAQILSVNERYCQMLGYTGQELCSMHVYDVDPNFPLQRWKEHRSHIRRHGSDTFETIHRCKDGSTLPVEVTTTYVSFQGDEFSISFIRDITERRQAEQRIRSLAKFPGENPGPVLRVAPDGALMYVNDAGLSQLREWRLTVGKVVPPMLRDAVSQALELGSTQSVDVDYDGLTYSFHVTPIVEAGYANLYGRDITKRRQAEERIQQQADELAAAFKQKDEAFTLLDTLMNSAPVGLAFLDRELRYQRINDTLAEVNGIAAADHIGHTVQELLPDLAPVVEPLFRRVLETRQPVINLEVRGETPKLPGVQRDWLASYYPVVAGDDSVLGLGLVVTEITERKQVEQALRESEERFRTLFENMTEGVAIHELVYDSEGAPADYTIVDVNPAYYSHTGIPKESAIGQAASRLYGADQPPYMEIYANVVTTGQPAHFETHFGPMDRHFNISAFSTGAKQFATLFADVTESKRAVQALRESEFFLRKSQTVGRTGSYLFDARTGSWTSSPMLDEIFGIDDSFQKSVEGWISLVHPEQQEEMRQYMTQHVLAERNPFEKEYRIIRQNDRQERWVYGLGELEFDDQGGAVRMIGTIQDITERKRVEQMLHASEERFRLLAENAQDVVFRYRITPAQGFEYLSPAVETITGYTPEDLYTRPELVGELFDLDDATLQDSIGSGKSGDPYILRCKRKDGQPIWIELRSTLIQNEAGELGAIEGIARDITERKRAEERIQKLNRIYAVLSNVNQAIVRIRGLQEIYDKACQIAIEDGRFRMAWVGLVDPENEKVLAVAHAGVTDGYLDALDITLSDEPHGRGPTATAVRTGKPVISNDIALDPQMAPWREAALQRGYRSSAAFPLIVANKVRGTFNLYSDSPGFFDEAENRLLAELAQDISFAMEFAEQDEQRRRAEEAIQKLNTELEQRVVERTFQMLQIKERVEAILNNSPDAIVLLGPDGLIDAGNPAFCVWFGYNQDQLYGLLPDELVAPGSAPELKQALATVVSRLETQRLEVVAQRRDGTTFDVTMALAPVQEAGNLFGVVCSLQDISKLKEVERMKDAFVSNVSHELRTPITSIKLNQKLIQMNPDRLPVYLERMEREVNRLNDLIEDLLRLSRLDQGRIELDLAPVNLNELVDEHVGDRSPIAESRSLNLSADKQPDLPEVLADRGLLGQALSVLLTNALNYTPSGGTISVRTAARQEGRLKWVGFIVSDTGPGIPHDEMSHLFERFYRGKTGRSSGMPGTGLGLAIAQEIVSRHKGRIEAGNNDAAGTGAVFSMWLPLKAGSG